MGKLSEDTNAVLARGRDEHDVVLEEGRVAYYINRTAGFTISAEPETLTAKIPDWARTMWLGVQGRGGSIAEGDFVLRLEGYRGQAPYLRTFTLPGLQTLAVDVQGFVGSLNILACSFTGVADALVRVCCGFDPQQRPDNALSYAFYAERRLGGVGGAVYPVPPGATEVSLAAAIAGSLSWRTWRGATIGAAGQFDVPGPGALGATQEVHGTHYVVPAGETADLVWRIQL